LKARTFSGHETITEVTGNHKSGSFCLCKIWSIAKKLRQFFRIGIEELKTELITKCPPTAGILKLKLMNQQQSREEKK
jgi:hypothetical protein